MGKVEKVILDGFPVKPLIWLRFIDDIFFIWTDGEQSLREFMDHMNNHHNIIKFTFESSKQEVNFLDVTVKVDGKGRISTELSTRPTDKHQYLFYT